MSEKLTQRLSGLICNVKSCDLLTSQSSASYRVSTHQERQLIRGTFQIFQRYQWIERHSLNSMMTFFVGHKSWRSVYNRHWSLSHNKSFQNHKTLQWKCIPEKFLLCRTHLWRHAWTVVHTYWMHMQPVKSNRILDWDPFLPHQSLPENYSVYVCSLTHSPLVIACSWEQND